jgi:hypothetical protein
LALAAFEEELIIMRGFADQGLRGRVFGWSSLRRGCDGFLRFHARMVAEHAYAEWRRATADPSGR